MSGLEPSVKIDRIAPFLLLASLAAPVALASDWSPERFPLEEGDAWVYRYETAFGSGPVQSGLRVKTIRAPEAGAFGEGVRLLIDAKGDTYAFRSDAAGLFVHGEIKPDGKVVRFDPPMAYVTAGMVTGESVESLHRTAEGEVTGRAELLGARDVETPAGRFEGCLASRFTYWREGRAFSIENDLAAGLGPVRRTFRLLDADGSETLTVRIALVAARVGGRATPSEDTFARSIFQSAFESRYTWGSEFPGFSAVAVVDGERFPFTVESDGSFEVGGTEGARQGKVAVFVDQLTDHRIARGFETAHAGHTFRVEGFEAGTWRIALDGDSMGSRYAVRDDRVVQVHRDQGGFQFSIHLDEAVDAGGKYLARSFRILPGGDPRRADSVTDEFVDVQGFLLPSRRTVRTPDGESTFEIVEHALRP